MIPSNRKWSEALGFHPRLLFRLYRIKTAESIFQCPAGPGGAAVSKKEPKTSPAVPGAPSFEAVINAYDSLLFDFQRPETVKRAAQFKHSELSQVAGYSFA